MTGCVGPGKIKLNEQKGSEAETVVQKSRVRQSKFLGRARLQGRGLGPSSSEKL